ncbi:MAG: WG repeat-containing protein [Crocinitomicaceae bacterium]
MKRSLLVLMVLLMSACSFAQDLRVIKDNINCTYGIKDKEGNWVVEPTYILIEEYNTGYFRVRDEIGQGMLTPNGKPLLPCIHDNIKFSAGGWHIINAYNGPRVDLSKQSHGFFYTRHRNKLIVYTLSGEKIGTFEDNTELVLDTDFSLIAYNRVSRHAKYIDSSGQVLIDSISGRIQPFSGRQYTMVADEVYQNGNGSGNARVINRKGESTLSISVDEALIEGETICFSVDKKFGVVSLTGDTIIAPKYKRLDGILSLKKSLLWVIYDDNDRAGLMKNTGRVLVEPIYDKMYQLKSIAPKEIAWMVEKGGRFGVLNSHGSELIPMNYDKLYLINFVWAQGNYRNVTTRYIGIDQGKHYFLNHQGVEFSSEAYDSLIPVYSQSYSYSRTMTHGIITKRNGKYGVLNPDGTELAACTYDLCYKASDTRYLLGQGQNLTGYNFSQNNIGANDWKFILSDQKMNIYSFQNRYIALTEKGTVYSNLQSFQRYENLLVSMEADSRKLVFYHLKTSRRLPLKNIQSLQNQGKERYQITTGNGKQGLIDGSGEMIIDTIYNNLEINSRSSKIWASKMVGNRYVNVLLDSAGRQVLPNQFDATFQINSGDQVVSQNQKKGIIDTKTLKWKIRPDYLCLIQLFDDYYYVGNEFNKKGIIRSSGKVILPAQYDSLILVYANCQMNGMCPSNDQTEIRWLAQKGNTEYVVDQNGKLTTSKLSIRKLKEHLLFDDDTTFGMYNYFRVFPVLDYTPSLHFLRGLTMQQIQLKRAALWENKVLKNEVLDTVNRIWSAQKSTCNQGYYTWTVTIEGDQNKPNQLAEKAKKSCQCYESNRYGYGATPFVYQLQSIGPKFVTLDIFYQNQNYGWDQPRIRALTLVPNNTHINLIEEEGKARYLTLDGIFPDEDMLMQEFIEALKQRDDLKLECSSLENMLAMINGSFSLSEDGIVLYLNQSNQNDYYGNSSVELLIPNKNLEKLEGSKWIVPFLKN